MLRLPWARGLGLQCIMLGFEGKVEFENGRPEVNSVKGVLPSWGPRICIEVTSWILLRLTLTHGVAMPSEANCALKCLLIVPAVGRLVMVLIVPIGWNSVTSV